MSQAAGQDASLQYIHTLLRTMVKAGGTDLFLSADFPPAIKLHGEMHPLNSQRLQGEHTRQLADALMDARHKQEFEQEMECNFAFSVPELSRFRVNVFRQLGQVGLVVRTIPNLIPDLDSWGLPAAFKNIVMAKRGLVLVVGAAGSGKSTSLAAMLNHRNRHAKGHIVTVEDPVEFVHPSQASLVTHREIGVDTQSWHHALKNALRQAPDVILIGEIRDTETMEQALSFAETGHLCLATLHATSANRTFDRVLNFFPEERRQQVLMDLSMNLNAIVSQRLLRGVQGDSRKAAVEILLNTPTMAEKIHRAEFHDIKAVMTKGRGLGMQTFDDAIFDLYEQGAIGYDEALRHADSENELRLNIKLKSRRPPPAQTAPSPLSMG
ncbi:PilT/PilU family type 4a pilus ATPase [Curvibacter sp. HBC28]|uniref:PilT/PilU family type 4a pilus ATPase n=1 Tax=Curvibacter microcysteis TaxID=3026419 RepID=A0ABT5MDE1_9BURK|nr:PilT/PilU family type 4a pilus ATPase [Curvibacter sp. HBC28]MDD0814603.1 PilT/PilU family type 4a pilus ATPase [Curvibacter sp. HBC28]